MGKLLVVVDGTAQSFEALQYALQFASARPQSELVLLHIRPPPQPWQVYRSLERLPDGASKRILDQAERLVEGAGVRAHTLILTGEKAAVVTAVARQESCDHIFVSQKTNERFSSALSTLIGRRAESAVNRIIGRCNIPVTVVTSLPAISDSKRDA